jgi:hypothetical protein
MPKFLEIKQGENYCYINVKHIVLIAELNDHAISKTLIRLSNDGTLYCEEPAKRLLSRLEANIQ